MTLSDPEKREIEALAASYPTPQTASIEALLIAQRSRGWISDETLAETAALLDMTVDELDSIATFYSRIFRRPAGAHVISVCDSVSCHVTGGGERLLRHLERKLGIRAGGTTADGKFTLIPNVCLGHCDAAPAMLIGDRLYGNLDEVKAERIIDETIERGAPPDAPFC